VITRVLLLVIFPLFLMPEVVALLLGLRLLAPRIHAHLFRGFARELSTAGNSLETVAALLGHSSTKITERPYSHWVKGRQEKLEDAVKNSWGQLGSVEVPRKTSKTLIKQRFFNGGGGGVGIFRVVENM
jgi:hypothetical protein